MRDRPAERATDREVGVVAAVLVAGSEEGAANRLGLSHSTLKHHLANARSKVGVATAQLVWILGPRLPEPIFALDLLFNEVHLFLTPDLDHWITVLEELQLDSPANVFPGHGLPTGPAAYAENISYIRTAQANLAGATSGEGYKGAMISAYPDWQEQGIIDFYPQLLSQE